MESKFKIEIKNVDLNKGKEFIKSEIRQAVFGPLDAFKGGLKAFTTKGRFDYFFFYILVILMVFGLAMCYSAGVNNSEQLKQLIVTGFSFGVMIVCSFISSKTYRSISNFAMAVMLCFLVALAIIGKRWITVPLVGTAQPSDIAKITMVMFLAYLLEKYQKYAPTVTMFLVFAAIISFFAILVFKEHHLSGAILFFLIGVALMWIGSLNRTAFYICLGIGIFAVIVVVANIENIPGLYTYQIERIVTWKKIITGQELTIAEKQGDAKQVLQSLYGISTGGLFGLGYGNSAQKYGNLSEASNDFIFAIIAEELGFAGALVLVFLFTMLVIRGFMIGLNSKSVYGLFLACGLSVQIALQVILNIGVATSLLPNTGIGLPFFSEGGTAMLSILIECGMILSISRESERKKSNV